MHSSTTKQSTCDSKIRKSKIRKSKICKSKMDILSKYISNLEKMNEMLEKYNNSLKDRIDSIDVSCPVCYSQLSNRTADSTNYMVLECSHFVCSNCIKKLLPTHTTCPLCRTGKLSTCINICKYMNKK